MIHYVIQQIKQVRQKMIQKGNNANEYKFDFTYFISNYLYK